MPYPSIFKDYSVRKLVLEDCVKAVNAELPKLRAIDEQRKIYLKLLTSSSSDPHELIKQGQLYIDQYVNYVAFTTKVNDKNDQALVDSVFKKVPQYEHASIVNGNYTNFTESRLELFFTLFALTCNTIDMQFKVSSAQATEENLGTINGLVKDALAKLKHLQTMAREIVTSAASVAEVAMELRAEFLVNIENLLKGLFFINACDRARHSNVRAMEAGEPLKWQWKQLCDLARSAFQHLELAQQQLDTAFKKELSKISADYTGFVKSMYVLSQIYCHYYQYKHYEEIANCLDYAKAQTGVPQMNANAAKLYKLMPAFDAVKIRSAGVGDWFSVRFSHVVYDLQRVPNIASTDQASPMGTVQQIKVDSYTLPEAIWDSLVVINKK